jgi:hypothetical protein
VAGRAAHGRDGGVMHGVPSIVLQSTAPVALAIALDVHAASQVPEKSFSCIQRGCELARRLWIADCCHVASRGMRYRRACIHWRPFFTEH